MGDSDYDTDSSLYAPAPAPSTNTQSRYTSVRHAKGTRINGSDKENQRGRFDDSNDEGADEDDIPSPTQPAKSSSKSKGKGKQIPSTQLLHEQLIASEGDKRFYDPDQALDERRATRRCLRDIDRDLNDNKVEYLQKQNGGLLRMIKKTNMVFKNVKQTSDATLDSRIMVTAGEMVLTKAKALDLGKHTGKLIDVDEFVGKLIDYMRNSPAVGGPAAERRRRQQQGLDADDIENDDDDGDAYDWAYLGRTAAFKGNKRPPTTDFLHGPLGVQKRIRLFKTRNSGLKRTTANIVRPEELKHEEIKQQENTTTKLVKSVAQVLQQYVDTHPIPGENQGVNYFRFVINPISFGQTIENIFYVSFLVRDGRAALFEHDETGMPMLGYSDPTEDAEEARDLGVKKRQVVCKLDMWSWKELIETLGIKESIIPHREAKPEELGATGWYG